MMTKWFSHGRLAWAAGLAAWLFVAGFAAPKAGADVAAQKETVLEYKMPAGQVLRYLSKEEMVQVSEAMGQSIETLGTTTGTYSFDSKGRKDQNHVLKVTIDDLAMSLTGTQGDLSPDVNPVKGKSFEMVLSPLGAEVDVSGAESITYNATTGPRNVSSTFKGFFPDLPGKPVRVGDSWPSSLTIEEKAGTVDIRLDFQIVNTLEGFETVDGMECARVSSKITGTISGTGSQQGMDMLFGGTHKGTDLWYFALKEGMFVKSTSETVSDMTISVSGAQSMTIPTTQTRKSEVKLAGR
jgi:hypothetical protein